MTKLNGTIILMDIGEYDKLLQKWLLSLNLDNTIY